MPTQVWMAFVRAALECSLEGYNHGILRHDSEFVLKPTGAAARERALRRQPKGVQGQRRQPF